MPRRAEDEYSAAVEVEVWVEDLTLFEGRQVIPRWLLPEVAREFSKGTHGKWRPSSGEFVTVCKTKSARFWAEWIRMRDFLGAQVVPPRPAIAGHATTRMDLTESLNRMFPGSKPIKPVDLKDDDWDGRRAAFVRDVTEREDARRQREDTR